MLFPGARIIHYKLKATQCYWFIQKKWNRLWKYVGIYWKKRSIYTGMFQEFNWRLWQNPPVNKTWLHTPYGVFAHRHVPWPKFMWPVCFRFIIFHLLFGEVTNGDCNYVDESFVNEIVRKCIFTLKRNLKTDSMTLYANGHFFLTCSDTWRFIKVCTLYIFVIVSECTYYILGAFSNLGTE